MASVHRYARSEEQPQFSGWAGAGTMDTRPPRPENLLLCYAAESYLDDWQEKQNRTPVSSGGGDVATSATQQPDPHRRQPGAGKVNHARATDKTAARKLSRIRTNRADACRP
ncbi:hypothetical protein P4S72_18120 [Vibrio sp. PP-XX7]